ncbi:sigma 54-interacting transcriptional regulator [Cytobacillus sp. Sa5YUA1]|uniref:Sigma 54-interacting transcriptional regulator n=1 Tax=Cytobacillus stercorigallinarum TaxID=2762240 RepID=A0ABR8QM61_9BACI|nr:sigma 54-interacting transcriptional regulator [Cytobacillus stercorigallinarum]MBD7936600.1 sigma 54-interacting transcriptional regulator [Cytobacillus stercorigallinarum]
MKEITLMDQSHQNPILIVNEHGRIITANTVFTQRFAMTAEELKEQLIEVSNFPYLIGKLQCLTILSVLCIVKVNKENEHYRLTILLKAGEISLPVLKQFLSLLQEKKKYTRANHAANYEFAHIIGESQKLLEVKELAARIAVSSSTVLITGESGTGKELFAQAIHHASPRRRGPFIAVNCAAIPPELFESEVFGYEEGAFSGAKKTGKPGKIELAQNGTLFLDEISELPKAAQGKLLRVLQEREVERLGSIGKKRVDIRIIAATNRDLFELVSAGEFRQDLYYRLFVFDLPIPPLRERKEDIIPLVDYFLDKYNQQLNKNVNHIHPHLLKWLMNHEWPGNIRELKAVVERGVTLSTGEELGDNAVVKRVATQTSHTECLPSIQPSKTLEEIVKDTERKAIVEALEETGGDKTMAAVKLNIHLASLYRKIAKYQIKT